MIFQKIWYWYFCLDMMFWYNTRNPKINPLRTGGPFRYHIWYRFSNRPFLLHKIDFLDRILLKSSFYLIFWACIIFTRSRFRTIYENIWNIKKVAIFHDFDLNFCILRGILQKNQQKELICARGKRFRKQLSWFKKNPIEKNSFIKKLDHFEIFKNKLIG